MSDLSYLPDLANHFYGFNGYESVLIKIGWMKNHPYIKVPCFYRFRRDQFGQKRFYRKTSGII